MAGEHFAHRPDHRKRGAEGIISVFRRTPFHVGVAGDPAQDFVSGLTPTMRPVAERLVAVIVARAPFEVAIKTTISTTGFARWPQQGGG
jgi:hypothetical protein